MGLKTWAPYDRLTAEDLNAATGYLSGSGLALPGVQCRVAGPTIATSTVNQAQTLAFGAPAAGTDPLGYYVAANGRAKVPVGLAGLYLLAATIVAGAPTGTASNAGAFASAYFQNTLAVGQGEPVGSFHRFDTAGTIGMSASVLRLMADGDEWWTSFTPRVVDGKTSYVAAWSMVRLASILGAFGA